MRFCIFFTAFLSYSATLTAEEIKNVVAINLEQVIVKVLEHNPEILAGDIEAQAAVARIKQAYQSKSPLTLNIELENFAGSGTTSGTGQLESTLSFTKVLELGKKPEMRAHVARQDAALLKNTQDVRKLDLLAEASRRFISIVLLQQKLNIAISKVKLIKSIQQITAKRIRLGKSPMTEQRRLTIELERAKLELEHVEHELKASLIRMSSLWGTITPRFNFVLADIYSLRKPESFESLMTFLDRNPDIARFANRERLAQARINLAKTRSRSDIEISGGIKHFRKTSDTALVLSANIPFGGTSRARPFIQEAKILSQLTPHKLAQRRIELQTELYDLYQEMIHAYEALKVFRNIIIPEAKLVLRDYKRGYAVGRYSFFELNNAQATLLDAQLEAAVIASNFHKNKIEIERLTGANLTRLEDQK